MLQTTYIRPEYFTREFRSSRPGRGSTPSARWQLFGITMAILLAPKLFGLMLMLLTPRAARRAGGGGPARRLGR